MPRELTFILGGARAGKSTLAESLARQPLGEAQDHQAEHSVLFVATAEAKDDAMARRIAAHRSRRLSTWDTLEESLDLVGAMSPVAGTYDTVVIDCLTVWAANLLLKNDLSPRTEQEATDHIGRLLDLHASTDARWIVVSNEVGLGVVPSTVAGGVFRDVLGRVNQAVAARSDRLYLVVAGQVLDLTAMGAKPLSSFSMDVR